MIQFDLPKNQSSIIKVIGVGGGGSNAVNHMYAEDIDGVDFIICNTDAQAIALSNVPNKIQLGPELTQGLGAGANPSVGRKATEESLEEIKNILSVNTKMVFVTAGMGGGTGTGGAPIIANICKELGILTVGIVTTPFSYEGKHRLAQAKEGINLLKENVDTLLVISNDKLRQQYGNLKMKEAFIKADNVLATAAKCITGVINSTGLINVDFADVCTVMRDGGVAILGSGTAAGENRAYNAIESALNSPLLNDNDIFGAKWILINITCSNGEHEFTMDEVEVIQEYIRERSGESAEVILGVGTNDELGDAINITLIATGFPHKDPFTGPAQAVAEVPKVEKQVLSLDMPSAKNTVQPAFKFEDHLAHKEPAKTEEAPAAPQTSVTDRLMPTLQADPAAPIATQATVAKPAEADAKVFFEISSTQDQTPVVQFDLTEASKKPAEVAPVAQANVSAPQEIKPAHDTNPGTQANNFLAKPAQIYAAQDEPKATAPTQQPAQFIMPQQEEETKFVMHIVEKQEPQQPEVQTAEKFASPLLAEPCGEVHMEDEEQELRKRAMDRLRKLKNMSINLNGNDPNSEFDNVPAYLRRNMEINHQAADVENFYSHYTVKTDDNNQSEISTINTYLDGKKPD